MMLYWLSGLIYIVYHNLPQRNMTHVQKILILLTLHFNVAHINISVLNTVPYFLDFRCKKNNNYTCATPVHVTP